MFGLQPQESEDCACSKKPIFRVRLQRWTQHICTNADCVQGAVQFTRAESWSCLMLESSPHEASHVAGLLAGYFQPENVSLRCEACRSSRIGQQQSSATQASNVLVLGVPRPGHIDAAGVQHKHTARVNCDHGLFVAGDEYSLVALVEHISASTDARSGHFVTWVKRGECWKRCDDAHVTVEPRLSESVFCNVVVVFYCKLNREADTVRQRQSAGAGSKVARASLALMPDNPEDQGALDFVGAVPPVENEGKFARVSSDVYSLEHDGHMEFENAVNQLLAAYASGSSEGCAQQLRGLPLFSCETTSPTWGDMCARLRASVQDYASQRITAAAAVQLAAPLWRTTFFPLAVLFEAWSRTTGLPTIFYIDSFYSLLGSLLNKHVTYDAAGFPVRARCWAVGTASPGVGKSPTLEPLKDALLEVLREMPDLAPGVPSDGFHVQPVGTHAAAVDRLRSTAGYQVIAAGEGGPVLCPAWPSSATWTQSTHLNWQRYLDAATGELSRCSYHVAR